MKRHLKIIAAMLLLATMLSFMSVPAFAYSKIMNYIVYYKDEAGNEIHSRATGTKDGLMSQFNVKSPTIEGYSLKKSSDSTVTAVMFTYSDSYFNKNKATKNFFTFTWNGNIYGLLCSGCNCFNQLYQWIKYENNCDSKERFRCSGK